MPKKILIVVGTRPNFIKITQFERVFNQHPGEFEYRLLHTGQHFDENMSDVFFRQLQLKKPDYHLNIEDREPARQIGRIIIELQGVMAEWRPDLCIVVGDVNSTLAAAIAANKAGVTIAHLESGLRSFDRAMPEEHNRLVADALSDHFFITEQSGIDHLSAEGKDPKAMHFVGNTMIDTLVAFEPQILASDAMERYHLSEKGFVLMTMHRPSTVDDAPQLETLLQVCERATDHLGLKVVFPIHPRTRNNIEKFGLGDRVRNNENIIFTPPLDYFSFQRLIKGCAFILTDSGGIQEESTYCGVPCLTIRENTERPSTITHGTNTLVPFEFEAISHYMDSIVQGTYKKGNIPPLWDGMATDRIVEVIRKVLQ